VDLSFIPLRLPPLLTLFPYTTLFRSGAFMDRLQSITAPTLVVGGKHDVILTPAILRDAIVAPIKGARFALLDSAHEIPVEQPQRSEEHTSELSHQIISYAVFCLNKKT